MVSSDKQHDLGSVSPEIKEIYEQAMSHEPTPDRVYDCPECKDIGWLDGDRGMYRCKCLIAKIELQRFKELMKEADMQGYEGMTFDNYFPQNDSQAQAHETIRDGEPGCFYVVGRQGVGKTHLMAARMNRALKSEHTAAIVVSALLLFDNLLTGDMEVRAQKFARVARIPKLVIDDLGKERKTEAVSNIRLALLNERYKGYLRPNSIMETSFTSTFGKDELMPKLGYDRDTYDRINGMSAQVVVLGDSYRKPPKIRRNG